MCYGMGCPYEQSSGPEVGDCTLSPNARRAKPADAVCVQEHAEAEEDAKPAKTFVCDPKSPEGQYWLTLELPDCPEPIGVKEAKR